MKIGEMVDETIKSGIVPIVFDYQRVNLFSGSAAVFRTFMVINSLDVGTLTYRQYRFVARRTKQGNHMVKRHIEKLIRLIPRLTEAHPEAACFTIPVYARLLKDGELARMLFDTFSLYPEVSPSSVCIELSADILYEDIADAKERMKELRDMGVKLAISEVGDEFCPVFRLAELPFDYAFADEFTTASLDRDDCERVAGSLVKFLHYLNAKVIAPELDNDTKIAGAKSVDFDGYTLAAFSPLDELLPPASEPVIIDTGVAVEAAEPTDEAADAAAEPTEPDGEVVTV
ncbi:MAG: EAL domain-containing protein [Clostridia bacterium]|nr:EAL domain-containing protein [Clostridia bacterium]